ncbi:MAG: LuxR family transcriptional regulator [Pseudomonadota bacterium]
MSTGDEIDRNLAGICDNLAGSLSDAIFQIRDRLQVKHVVYHSARQGTKPVDAPFIRLTHSAEWVHRYLTKNYILVDPVTKEGFQRTAPFNWREIGPSNEDETAFLRDAAEHGIGTSGYSIPLRDKNGRLALFSVSSDQEPIDWQPRCKKNSKLWTAVGRHIHKRAIEEMGGEVSIPRLTPREREALYWTAQGKTAADIGLILGLATYTVSTYLRSARYKTNSVSITQAVYKAQQLGILQRPENTNDP